MKAETAKTCVRDINALYISHDVATSNMKWILGGLAAGYGVQLINQMCMATALSSMSGGFI